MLQCTHLMNCHCLAGVDDVGPCCVDATDTKNDEEPRPRIPEGVFRVSKH